MSRNLMNAPKGNPREWKIERIRKALKGWLFQKKSLSTIARECQTNVEGVANIHRKIATNYGQDPKAERRSIRERIELIEDFWKGTPPKRGEWSKRELDMLNQSISEEGKKNGANDPSYIALYLNRSIKDVEKYLKGRERPYRGFK